MRRLLALVPLAALVSLAACGSKSSPTSGVAITATDTTCAVAQTTFSPGDVTFTVTNQGSKVTEVYVYAGSRIVTEVENIGPGTSRSLTASLTPGTYEIACKPGQTGDGIRTPITVTGTAATPSTSTSASAPPYDFELELEVTAAGVEMSAPQDVKAGQKVEFKLENKSTGKRELEIIDPNGKEVAAIEAGPNGAAETVVTLTLPGQWKLKVEGDGVPDVVKTLAVT